MQSQPRGHYSRMACHALQYIPGHITTAVHQQIMGIAPLRISAPKIDPGRPEPAHSLPHAMVHSQQIWGAALVIPGLVKVGPRLPQHLQHLCAPVEGRPGGGGHARCQTHLIQRTALLHQPFGRGIVAAIEGRDQRIETCALLHIGDIVTVPQAQLQRSNIAFFSGLEQFHTHFSTSIS